MLSIPFHRSLQSLSASMKGRYVITVEVKDNGGLSSTSEVVVTIPLLVTPKKHTIHLIMHHTSM